MNMSKRVKSVLSVSWMSDVAFGDAEVDHLGQRHAVVGGDKHVRGLEVTVDDALLVRVLHRLANLDEQVEPLRGGELVLLAVVGDLDSAHQLHDEIRTPRFRRPGIENLRDVRMIHHRQRLTLGLEARDDGVGFQAQLDDLQRHPAFDRLRLLSHVNDTAAALADFLEQLVATNAVAFPFGDRDVGRGRVALRVGQKSTRRFPGSQEIFNLRAQGRVVSASLV